MKNYPHYFYILFLVFVVSCQSNRSTAVVTKTGNQDSAEDILTDSCTISGTTYRIYQRDTLAYMEASGQRDTVYVQLLLRAPVYIVRAYRSNEALTYSYPQFNADQVVMLFGEKIDPTDQADRGLHSTHWCGGKAQGLIVRKDRSTLTDHTLNVVRCKGFSSDEKDFYTLAEGTKN